MKSKKKSRNVAIAGVFVAMIALLAVAFFAGAAVRAPQTSDSSNPVSSSDIVQGNAAEDNTEELLLYLVEEEKLAHDVYTKMYEVYGARVFGNILKSESTHQDAVLTLLNARGVTDPRSDQIGVFSNTELQELYDSLIAKGSLSAKDAYEAGVAIEEKDIADISRQLETAKDQGIITTLESLRRGSENHLRAFNRQL